MVMDIILTIGFLFGIIYVFVLACRVSDLEEKENYVENCIIADEQKLSEDEKRITRLEERVRG